MVSQHGGRAHMRRVHRPPVRFWPAALAILSVGIAYGFLPDRLREGPRWLLAVLIGILLAAAAGTRWRGYLDASSWIGRALTVLVTLAVAASILLLVTRLPTSHTGGRELLVYAALLWVINVVVFALWFWEIDGGGPHERHPDTYGFSDFVFPQFQQDPDRAATYWMPGFIDYLFLAFNTSTAFGPTDTLIMSQRAKVLMMAESGLSLLVIAILAARAISLL
jgi:hypothetical protein